MSYAKPLPVLDSETQPFWEGCRQGKLRLQRCTQCGHVRFRPPVSAPNADRSSTNGSIAPGEAGFQLDRRSPPGSA